MEFGQFTIEFDKTGFPLVKKREWNFFISLFPISKYQFEIFLFYNFNSLDIYTDEWYRKKLSLNPRKEWNNFKNYEYQLFLTGLTYNEINPFLRYLGKDFRLPKDIEWKKLHEIRNEIKELSNLKDKFKNYQKNEQIAKPVCLWIEKLSIPLTEECVLEMLDEGESFIGKPTPSLFRNIWSPTEVRKINRNSQNILKAIGFRVVKSEE